MWKCPVCGREFSKKNQSHFCSDKPTTVEEYISAQSEDHQADLLLMREILHKALPEAEERISWSMPTYRKGCSIVHFAASKNHIGFYPGEAAVKQFAAELLKYKTEKGTVRIPYGQIDQDLVFRIAQWCMKMSDIK